MSRHAGLAVFALVALALLIFALLPPPTKSDVPATAVPQSEFEAIRSAGITVVGTSYPTPALLQPRTLTPAPSPAPATLAIPSMRPMPRLASVARSGTSTTGIASWFRSPVGVSAAGPELRAALGPGWRGTRVTVSGPAGTAAITLGDFMRADRLIDLDAPAFRAACGPLSRGICTVTVVR